MNGRHFHHLPIGATDKYEIFRFGDCGDGSIEYRVKDKESGIWVALAFVEPEGCYVKSVRVHADFLRRGIATLLYDEIEKDLDISLHPDPRPGSCNTEAREFWKSRGWRF